MVLERGVLVDLSVLGSDVLDTAPEVGTDELGQLQRVVKRVAPPEGRLLRKLGEGQEPLRPADVPKTAASGSDGKTVDGSIDAPSKKTW